MNVRDRLVTDEIRENELLGALPADDFERLLPGLERVLLPHLRFCTISTMRSLTSASRIVIR